MASTPYDDPDLKVLSKVSSVLILTIIGRLQALPMKRLTNCADGKVKWCKVITETIQDELTSAEIGSATA
jgi:hypothetical protein